MSRPSHSLNQREREIWQACDDLLAIGKSIKEITGEAIVCRLRELKYKAGSKSYIYRYRDSWMVERGISREDEPNIDKEALSDPIMRATQVFKEGLVRELQQEYQSKFEALEMALADEQATKLALQDELDVIKHTLDVTQEEKGALEAIIVEKTAAYQSQHEELIGLRAALAAQQAQLQASSLQYEEALSSMKAQQVSYQRDHKQLLHDLKSSHKERLSQMQSQFEAQRHRAIVEIDDLKLKNQQLSDAIKIISEEKAALLKQCEISQKTLENVVLIEQRSQQQHSDQNTGFALLHKELDKQAEKIVNLEDISQSLDTINHSQKTQLAKLTEKVECILKNGSQTKMQAKLKKRRAT